MDITFKTDEHFPEYSDENINNSINFLKDSTKITNMEENGKFSLHKKGDFFALKDKTDTEVYAWSKVSNRMFHGKNYLYLDLIYVLPKYRNTGISMVLFHGIKETAKTGVIIDSAVFKDGEHFINSLAKKDIYNVKFIDRESGKEMGKFEIGNLSYRDNKIIMVETIHKEGLYLTCTPGSDHKTYIPRYPEVII